MRLIVGLSLSLSILSLVACRGEAGDPGEPALAGPLTVAAGARADTSQPGASAADAGRQPRTAGEVDFPTVPRIVVPEIVGIGPAQRALEQQMGSVIDPMAGLSVRPVNCGEDGIPIMDAGITSVDDRGNFTRNGDAGLFQIGADGTGTANYGGGIITVNADGSGTINGSGVDGADEAIIRVEADGSGTYNGRHGLISLDGKGAGTWNSDSGIIINNGDGSGSWNGPQGIVRIEADGSGTWNGPHGMIVNHGDGSGRVGTPGREVPMAPIPRLAPEGRFPPLQQFAAPGAPCGFVITLDDRVLFDFDRSDIRDDASRVLDSLAAALPKVDASAIEVGGHTDAKGSDAYNLALSGRRAEAVVQALRKRGVAMEIGAQGYGELQPVAPNEIGGQDNPAGRQLNRRVEILVRT